MLLEDQSQIESLSLSFLDSGRYGTFISIYDGHGRPGTSRYSPSDSISFLYSRSLKPKMLCSSKIGHSISLCSFSFINSFFQYEMRIMERR
ncbi:hypothetical protein L2E82_42452 [Cichorium intybus]|uniref:Uncharacterized protein n=1 Tax=Cichorium intybus TaxID=13427 RepID=A0ACB8ZL39_CICIN|nr:hypothetical protein L2E82_42452 [Cichorium intybus]